MRVSADLERVNELVDGFRIGDIPLLTEEGWTRHQEKWCEATLFGADGVVAHKPRYGVSDHPVCAASVASRLFLTGAATPPHEEGIVRLIQTVHKFVHSFIDRAYISSSGSRSRYGANGSTRMIVLPC